MSDHRIFVDTNLWLYLFLKGQDEQKAGRLRSAMRKVDRPVISVQVISECCANLIRKMRVDQPTLMRYGNILAQRCEVVDLDRSIMRQALERYRPGLWSWWDTLIIVAALSDGCTELWSEDLQHGHIVDDLLRIINPLAD